MGRAIPGARLAGLESAARGLNGAELAERRRYGANDILAEDAGRWRALLGETLGDPMLWFLLGTALLFALLGDRAEALTLLLAVVPLLGMDAWLHRRTQASTAGLASRLAGTARVLRDVHERWETPARAESVYGVVFSGSLEDDSLAVDVAATAARRRALAGGDA